MEKTARKVNGVEYGLVPSSLPAPMDDSHWDGGPLGGIVVPIVFDGLPNGYRVQLPGTAISFSYFHDAAICAQRRQRHQYEQALKRVADYEAALRVHRDRAI